MIYSCSSLLFILCFRRFFLVFGSYSFSFSLFFFSFFFFFGLLSPLFPFQLYFPSSFLLCFHHHILLLPLFIFLHYRHFIHLSSLLSFLRQSHLVSKFSFVFSSLVPLAISNLSVSPSCFTLYICLRMRFPQNLNRVWQESFQIYPVILILFPLFFIDVFLFSSSIDKFTFSPHIIFCIVFNFSYFSSFPFICCPLSNHMSFFPLVIILHLFITFSHFSLTLAVLLLPSLS